MERESINLFSLVLFNKVFGNVAFRGHPYFLNTQTIWLLLLVSALGCHKTNSIAVNDVDGTDTGLHIDSELEGQTDGVTSDSDGSLGSDGLDSEVGENTDADGFSTDSASGDPETDSSSIDSDSTGDTESDVVIPFDGTCGVYVSVSGDDANDGLSWRTAVAGINRGLDMAEEAVNTVDAGIDRVTVCVGIGLYTPGKNREDVFRLRSNVDLLGGFEGEKLLAIGKNPFRKTAVLSGDIGVVGDSLDNSYHVVRGADDASLEGFVITGGNANAEPEINGGGMINYKTAPEIRRCVFTQNNADGMGGGLFNEFMARPAVDRCAFFENSALLGAGVANEQWSESVFMNSIFYNNISLYGGGAIYNKSSSPLILNCTIALNVAEIGGGLHSSYESFPRVKNSIVYYNQTAVGEQISNAGGEEGKSVTKVAYSNIETECDISAQVECDEFTLTAAPGLVNLDALDFNLGLGSVCIDGGNSSLNGSMVDLIGNPRVSGEQIDMGALEFIF